MCTAIHILYYRLSYKHAYSVRHGTKLDFAYSRQQTLYPKTTSDVESFLRSQARTDMQ